MAHRLRPPPEPDYRALAEFRYQLRRFLTFSGEAARSAGLEPQQHQVLLAVKGLSPEERPNVATLAERMQLKHHTVVGLLDRLAERGLVERQKSPVDAREILIRLTGKGERLLGSLSTAHHSELDENGPALVKALQRIVKKPRKKP